MLDFLFDPGMGRFSMGKFSKGLISKNHFRLGIQNRSLGLGSSSLKPLLQVLGPSNPNLDPSFLHLLLAVTTSLFHFPFSIL